MKQIYVGIIDEIPDLSLTPHEILEEATSEEVVAMWNTLKKKYIEALDKIKELEKYKNDGWQNYEWRRINEQ
jgi:hypothetical protein